MASIKITQRKSAIGESPVQRRTLRALGLRKIGHSVVRPDTPDVRGMVGRIRHLVEVSEDQQ
jgi:large subunit ribosomal protein L30